MQQGPIGVFDSGLGGLSVWREVARQFPQESLVYVADSGHCPYGPRTQADVTQLSHQIVRFLRDKGCKLIVVACNTATTAAIQTLREVYSLPFVGMEPAIKPAVSQTQSGVIGVLATMGTLSGSYYQRSVKKYGDQVTIIGQEGKGLVEAVENGQIHSSETKELLAGYLAPMRGAGADQLVLGCTHYPFLTPVIQEIVGTSMQVIDPSPAIARQVGRLLDEHALHQRVPHEEGYQFYSTGKLDGLKKVVFEIAEPAQWQRSTFASLSIPAV